MSEWKEHVKKALYTTINKFRENPITFFNEYDVHAYFYKQIYSDKLIVKDKFPEQGKKPIHLKIPRYHQEYPTIFKYSGKKLNQTIDQKLFGKDPDNVLRLNKNVSLTEIVEETFNKTNDNYTRTRGNSDFAIIKKCFIEKKLSNYFGHTEGAFNPERIYEIINRKKPEEDADKDIQDLIVEMKFVNSYSKGFTKEVVKDFFKLIGTRKALKSNKKDSPLLINLVFCSVPDFSSKDGSKTSDKQKQHVEWVREITTMNNVYKKYNILGIFVQSYFDRNGKKNKLPQTNSGKDWRKAIDDYFKS